jgi:FkbM family methyltransferase
LININRLALSAIARRSIERITRNWVYRRHLPKAVGGSPIFVTPSAGLKYLFKPMSQIDPPLLQNTIEIVRPHDIVWDVGANVGLFTFAAACRSGPEGHVVAFEPDTFLVECLRKSARHQPAGSAPVTVISAAIASEISIRAFTIASRSRASNSMRGYGQTQMGVPSESQAVVALNLDWIASKLPAPNVIKCDVEGAEAEVFTGQAKILNEIRPVIICEVARDTAARMTTIFVENRYILYDGDKPLSANARTERTLWNTIAIPKELNEVYLKGR